MGWRDGLESLGRGAANTLTGGLNDEIVAKLLAALPQSDGTGIGREYKGGQYEQYRDQQRDDEAKARAANPKLFMGGQLAGAIPTTMALPGSGLAGLGVGAARGAVQGFGDSTKSGQGLAKDTALGASIGTLAAGAGQGLQAIGKAAAPAMKALWRGGPPKSLPPAAVPKPSVAPPPVAPEPVVPAAFTKPTVPAPPPPGPTVPAPAPPTLRPTVPSPSIRPTSPAPAPPPPVPKLPPRPQPSLFQPREATLEGKLATAYNSPNAAALRPRTPAEEAVVMQELAKMPNLRQAPLPVRNMVSKTNDILAVPGSAPIPSTPPTPLSAMKSVSSAPTAPAPLPAQMRPPPPPPVPRTGTMLPPPGATPGAQPPPPTQVFGEYSGSGFGEAGSVPPPEVSPSALERAIEEFLKKKGGG